MLIARIVAIVAIFMTCLLYTFMEARKAMSGFYKATVLSRVLL